MDVGTCASQRVDYLIARRGEAVLYRATEMRLSAPQNLKMFLMLSVYSSASILRSSPDLAQPLAWGNRIAELATCRRPEGVDLTGSRNGM